MSSSRSASRTRPRRWRCASAWRCPRAARPRCWRELRADDSVHEAVAISTCNRTELYLVAADPVEAETAALAVLARAGGASGPPS